LQYKALIRDLAHLSGNTEHIFIKKFYNRKFRSHPGPSKQRSALS